jgi:hypothetical protein
VSELSAYLEDMHHVARSVNLALGIHVRACLADRKGITCSSNQITGVKARSLVPRAKALDWGVGGSGGLLGAKELIRFVSVLVVSCCCWENQCW